MERRGFGQKCTLVHENRMLLIPAEMKPSDRFLMYAKEKKRKISILIILIIIKHDGCIQFGKGCKINSKKKYLT